MDTLGYKAIETLDHRQSASSIAQTFNDDVALKLGTGGTASILWETADANANALIFAAPEGGATDVPVFIFGDASIINADLTFFNGITEPSIAILDDDKSAYLLVGFYANDQPALRSANAITIMPSGDVDDYFTFSTVANIPTLAATGADYLGLVSGVKVSGTWGASLAAITNSNNYIRQAYLVGAETGDPGVGKAFNVLTVETLPTAAATHYHVAGYFGALAPASCAADIWALNTLATLAASSTGNAVSLEVDLNNNQAAGKGTGLVISGVGVAAPYAAIHVQYTTSEWQNGVFLQNCSGDAFIGETSGSGKGLNLTSSSPDAAGVAFLTYHNSASPANGDFPFQLKVAGKDSGGNYTEYAIEYYQATNVTHTAETAQKLWYMQNAGSFGLALSLTGAGVMGIQSYAYFPNSVDSGAVADQVAIGGYELSAGHRALGISSEETVVSEVVVSDRTLQARINGVTYKFLLKS